MSDEEQIETEEQRNAREAIEANLMGSEAKVEKYVVAGKYDVVNKNGAKTGVNISEKGDVQAHGEEAIEMKSSLTHGQKLPDNPEFVSSIKQAVIDRINATNLPGSLKANMINKVETTDVVKERIDEINRVRDEAQKAEEKHQDNEKAKENEPNPMKDAMDHVLGEGDKKGPLYTSEQLFDMKKMMDAKGAQNVGPNSGGSGIF
ncbi:MAG: hypothetical protein R3Y43_00975 [Alphaproteobacteria bacterium]